MGVDQYTSAHIFENLSDGGRIVLDRDDPQDTRGIAIVREHMRFLDESLARAEKSAAEAQAFLRAVRAPVVRARGRLRVWRGHAALGPLRRLWRALRG